MSITLPARLILIALTIVLPSTTYGIAQETLKEAPRVTSDQRFGGSVNVRVKTAFTDVERGINVDLRTWKIGGGVKMSELPLARKGFMIVQLRAGELTTVINGVRKERRTSEFWTVPMDVKMGLETEDDSASLKTIVITEN